MSCWFTRLFQGRNQPPSKVRGNHSAICTYPHHRFIGIFLQWDVKGLKCIGVLGIFLNSVHESVSVSFQSKPYIASLTSDEPHLAISPPQLTLGEQMRPNINQYHSFINRDKSLMRMLARMYFTALNSRRTGPNQSRLTFRRRKFSKSSWVTKGCSSQLL